MADSNKFSQWGSTCEEMIRCYFPLHRACRDGDVTALSMLLVEAQHGVYEEDNFYGWTPAHWAAYFGKLACLRKLMSVSRVGADCDINSSRFCQTPTHLAAFGGHPHCLHWLIQAGASIDAQDYLGETPSHKAARTGSMECCSLLISHGARSYICNHNGQTAAELAAKCGFMECAKFMEAGEKRQAADPKGIYQSPQIDGSHIPSPHDITASRPSLSNGTGTTLHNGVNGCGDHVTGVADCDMDEEMEALSQEQNGFTDTALSRLFAQPSPTMHADDSDVTINHEISTNQIAVAGRKRTREDADDTNIKRQRTSELMLSSSEHIGTMNGIVHQAVQANNCIIPTAKLHSNHCPVNGVKAGRTLNGFTNGHSPHLHNGSFHNAEPVMEITRVSSSADEHKNTVLLAQGYDSMCYEAMTQSDMATNFY